MINDAPFYESFAYLPNKRHIVWFHFLQIYLHLALAVEIVLAAHSIRQRSLSPHT